MASSERLASVEPWSFRQSFGVESWLLPESTFSHDSDILTRALHKSISTTQHNTFLLPDPLSPSPFLDSSAISESSPSPVMAPAITLSGGSDPETPGTKRKRNSGPGGKPPKRRARASRKSQTTFITADPANFRQMVQQVTGAKYIGSSHNIFAPIVKPEPHRLANRLLSDRSGLPTLDTSAYLSNQEILAAGNDTFSGGETGLGSSPITSFQSSAAADVGGSTVELDNYPSFPTLESWKVM